MKMTNNNKGYSVDQLSGNLDDLSCFSGTMPGYTPLQRIPLSHQAANQRGVVLIWAVVFLLVVTIISVSAVRMSRIDTQIAGNSEQTMLAYQGAESGLGKAATPTDINNIIPAALRAATVPSPIPALYLPDENVSGGAAIASNGNIQYETSSDCSTDIADSSDFACDIYQVNVTSRIQGTGVRTTHTAGVALKQALVAP